MQGNKRKTKHEKMVSDMSVMNPSELWKMLVDDRIRDVLLSVSSSKCKGYRTNQNVRFTRVCTAFTADHRLKSKLKA